MYATGYFRRNVPDRPFAVSSSARYVPTWLWIVISLAFLRVRGIERVRLHADLTMLGRPSLALARAVPLAA